MKAVREKRLPQSGTQRFDVEKIRRDFPILKERVHGKPLVYLDNGATSQKPQVVIDALNRYYMSENSNIHRGVHYLSERATSSYEGAREKIRQFLNAESDREIVFVRGTTEAINLVAQSYGRTFLKAGNEIVISAMEHHSNIVPWQILCGQIGARLRVVPINHDGEFLLDEYRRLLSEKTKLVSLTHVSNALGSIVPVKEAVRLAHERAVPVLLDGAQAVPHFKVDVQDIGCDFYAFSGHKLFGPTGVGVLYGKTELLDAMPPYQGGGDMISLVTFEKTHYNVLPYKFEAGTPNIAGGIGLGAAIDYLNGFNWEEVCAHENDLLAYATNALSEIESIRINGSAKDKAGVLSFVSDHIHAHDV
ncbi:MAG TPA: SufS family cysteine desulfurase, partial [Candidatus Binatia bacterium]|nr:SufS family cysteine desulfurase [Candidatus Binatia bacterium]